MSLSFLSLSVSLSLLIAVIINLVRIPSATSLSKESKKKNCIHLKNNFKFRLLGKRA